MNKVWILDDDKSIRWVFEKALSKANIQHKTFANTNEAINQFNKEKPAVIVSDIRMPGESGIEFLTKVKNNTKIYSPSLKNYRTYLLAKIQNVFEIRFEQDVLQNLFGEKTSSSQKRQIINEEINDTDEND